MTATSPPARRPSSEQVSAPPALATTTTALAASAKVVHKGQTVRFTATVRATSGAGTPTGTVSFLAGNVVVARVRLNAAGQASFKLRFAANGRFVIRAVYSGDSNFAASDAVDHRADQTPAQPSRRQLNRSAVRRSVPHHRGGASRIRRAGEQVIVVAAPYRAGEQESR